MRSVVVVVFVLGLAGAGCFDHVQHRAALVPHAVPVHTTGQPAAWRGEVAMGASNAGDLVPASLGDRAAGLAIPTRQLRGSASVAVTRDFTLTFIAEHGLRSSARALSSTLPPLPDKGVWGRGTAATYSAPIGPQWRLGITVETIGYSVPLISYTTCVDPECPGGMTEVREETFGVPSFGFGFVPSYQHREWTFFGGMTVRTHPTIDEKVMNHGESPIVDIGPGTFMVHGGVAYEIEQRAKLVVDVHQMLTPDPVTYGPGIGFSLVLGLGPRFRDVPRRQVYVDHAAVEASRRHDAARDRTREAQRAAASGNCHKVSQLAVEVQRLDADHYRNVFLGDALIAWCVDAPPPAQGNSQR